MSFNFRRYADRSGRDRRPELEVFSENRLFCAELVDDVFDDERHCGNHLRNKPERQGKRIGARLVQSRVQENKMAPKTNKKNRF